MASGTALVRKPGVVVNSADSRRSSVGQAWECGRDSGGRSWSKPGFREETPLWIRQPGQPCSSVHPKYLEIQVDVGRIGGVMHVPRDE